jgi:hypothetical protein
MTEHRIEIRLVGTQEDLEKWEWFLEKMNEKGLVTILEKSRLYKNRGESLLYRQYLKINLNIQE